MARQHRQQEPSPTAQEQRTLSRQQARQGRYYIRMAQVPQPGTELMEVHSDGRTTD